MMIDILNGCQRIEVLSKLEFRRVNNQLEQFVVVDNLDKFLVTVFKRLQDVNQDRAEGMQSFDIL